MRIERLNNEILIRLPDSVDITGLQRLLDYLNYNAIISKSKATSKELEDLSKKIKSDWWKKNKSRFIK